MKDMYAQGDILIERVSDVPVSGTILRPADDGAVVLAEGEVTGHRHAIYDRVMMFRDDALARDVPGGLYVGHVKVEEPTALVQHEEHAPIALPRGTWRIRRQRQMEPRDARLIAD